MQTFMTRGSRQRGMALLMAMFLVLISGLLVSPILLRTVFQHNNTFRETRYSMALHLAEAGVDEAIWHLSYDKEKVWAGWDISDTDFYSRGITQMKDADGQVIGEYEVTIDQPIPIGSSTFIGPLPFPITAESEPIVSARAGVPTLTSEGGELRVVEVRAKARTIFSLGLFSDLDLELGGTTSVNSYDSRLGVYNTATNAFGNGDAGSNNNILLNGTPIIDGDAAAGGSVIIKNNNAEITGEVEGGMTHIDLPPVNDLVTASKTFNDNAGIPKAIKSNGTEVTAYNAATGMLDIAAGATLTLPGGTKDDPKIYYLKGGKLNGNSKLIINDYVVIMTDGSLDFSGGTVINNAGAGPPEKLMVYSSGNLSTEIKINGGAGFAGVVYSPGGTVTYSGGGNIFGATVAGKVNMQGNAQFHYDEALGETGLIAFFEVNTWTEKVAETSSGGGEPPPSGSS